MNRFLSCLTLALSVVAQTDEERERFPDLDSLMTSRGYEWETHEAKTEDGWYLTLFRITKNTAAAEEPERDEDRVPLLIQHGFGGDSIGWLAGGIYQPSLPMQLFDRGYDVWMGNNRGTKPSNRNERDGEWSLEERWNFNYGDMGVYDMPAQIEKVLEVTEKPTLKVIGYSQGSAQNLYGLATMQDWFAKRVDRFVAIAPCINAVFGRENYPRAAADFQEWRDDGEYIFEEQYYGRTEPLTDCSDKKYKGKDCEYEYGSPISSLLFFRQAVVSQRFQEFIPLDSWAKGNYLSPLVDLANIDRVPTSFVIPINDGLCPPQYHEYQFAQIEAPESYLRYERGGHSLFWHAADDAFVRRMVQTIETGQAEVDDGGPKSAFVELIFAKIFGLYQ